MGSFFDSLRINQITVDKQLLNASGSKLREYYCSFRSICEDFIIRIPEYVQIFSSNVKSFSLWDPQKKGTIDAMQMFSGLIIFSKMAFEDKIKFLYQIFDLNQQQFLQYDELVYLFMNVCEATCKIYQIKSSNLSSQILEQYLDQFFSQQTQLNQSDFLRWSYKCDEIYQFFKIIGHPFERQINQHSICQFDQSKTKSKRNTFLNSFRQIKQSKLNIKLDQRFLNLLKNDHILLQEQKNYQKNQQFNPKMKWIYGIRIDDIRYPLHYRKSQIYKAANQKFIYICGKNIIVLYPKLNIQKNYTNHQQQVSCIELGQNDTLVASGQMGLYPSIHLWNIKTVTCICKFDKIHKHSIKMLKFIKNNQLLISISQKQNSSIVILNINTKQKVLSTYLIQPVLNIINFKQQDKEDINQLFFVLPSYIVKCSSQDNIGYMINYFQVKKFMDNKKQIQPTQKFHTAANIKSGSQNMIILNDKLGNLSIFNPFNNTFSKIHHNIQNQQQLNIKQVNKQQQKIIDIFSSNCKNNRLYFLYQKSFTVYQIDNLSNLSCVCTVSNIPAGLFNLQLVELIQINLNSVILVSLMGDVIKVSNFLPSNIINQKIGNTKRLQQQVKNIKLISSPFVQTSQLNSLDQLHIKSNQIQFSKYYQIFKIQKITGICYLSKQGYQNICQHQQPKLVIASNSLIYIIDQMQKQLLSLKYLQQNITHIHSVGAIYAVATQYKYIMILRDGAIIEKAKCIGNNGNNSLINGFKITADNLIVAIDQQIYLYYKYGGNYLQKQCKKIKIQHVLPIHISMTSIPKVFLVITRQKGILKLNSQSKQKNVVSAKQLNCDFLQTYYPQTINTKAPILFSGTKKIFLLAQPNGDIYYWNSLNHLIKNQQSYSVLTGHTSYVNQLMLTTNGFISTGSQDGQIIIWQNLTLLQQSQQQSCIQQQDNHNYLDKLNKKKSKIIQQNILQVGRIHEQSFNIDKLISRLYMDQINCFDKFMCDKLMLKDSQVDVIVRDGQLYKDIAKIINHIIMPNNLQLFQPLLQTQTQNKKSKSQPNKKNNNLIKSNHKNRQKLSINLTPSFIYGFNSQKIRQSLFYIHHYYQRKIDFKDIRNIESINSSLQKYKKKQINYIEQLLLPINQVHENCKRNFFYFSGRTGIIWSPAIKKQVQYDFHNNRITCASVHPNKKIVCTAQISNSYPIIHVWNTDQMTLIYDFKSRHNRFVNRIQFSRDGDFIISLGGPPFQQSIQVYNWIRQQPVCFKYFQQTCFYDIKPNPYDFNEIAVCGVKSLWILRVSNRTLIKKQQAKIVPNQQIICMVYTSSVYGKTIQSDIITGNSNGDLSLFICGKYIKCKKSAHQKSINCLKLCQLFKYKTVIISASQDNTIKFWDTKFNQIICINVKQIITYQKSINQTIIAPQSIDIFQCFSNKNRKNNDWALGNNHKQQSQDHSETILLVGTRNGCIFQVKISNQYQGLQLYIIKNNYQNSKQQLQKPKLDKPSAQLYQKLQLNYITHFTNLPSMFNRCCMFDIKNNFMLTYSKTLQYFIIWNIQKKQIIKITKINSFPSIIKFTKTNNICVGYLNGKIQFLQIGNSWNLILRQQKITMSQDYQPINIIFSQNDHKIVVEYTKQTHKRLSNNIKILNQRQKQQNYMEQGQQILILYQKILTNNIQLSLNKNIAATQKDNHRIIIDKNKTKYKYIYWYQFNNEGNKLLICFTFYDYYKLNNQNRKRMIGSIQNIQYQSLYQYVLYDITKRSNKNITNQEFNMINFSPAVRAKYLYYQQCKVYEDTYQVGQHQPSINAEQTKKFKSSFTLNSFKNKSNQKNIELHSDQLKIINVDRLNQTNMLTQIQEYVPICQMAQFQNFTLMATVYGEVFAIRSGYFYFPAQQESELRTLKAKCYTVFDSPINNMQVVGNKLFISAKDCGTIAEFTLTIETQTNNLSLQKLTNQNIKFQNNAQPQKYYEIYTSQKIQNWLKYIFPKRKNCYQIKQNCRSQKMIGDDNNRSYCIKDQIILQPYHIIGRNAFYKRNNVLIDLKDNIITFSGCNLLIMSPNVDKKSQQKYQIRSDYKQEQYYRVKNLQKKDNKELLKFQKTIRKKDYKQSFLKIDNSIFSVNPEISTITLSHDRRTLFAGTTQENCQVIIWDISTQTELEHIGFKGYVSIILIKVSQQQKYVIVLALNKKSKQVLFFISLTRFQILASFCIPEQTIICDFQFLPSNQFKFLACGTNYIAEWTYKGGLLTNQKYSMKNPKDYSEINEQKYVNRAQVIFYSIIFLKDVAITGGSDGYLYMWSDRSLIKKQNANPKSAILTLYAAKNSKIFASGAVDGRAIVWQLGSSSMIQKVFQFSVYSGKQSIIPAKFHIQSVNIGKDQIFVGTRSGEIHRFEFNCKQTNESQDYCNVGQNHSLIVSAFDNDKINSCSFNISFQKLYILTQSGIFSVFNLQTNEKIKQQKIKNQNDEIIKMLVCKLSSKIYIIFKKSIEAYTYNEQCKFNNKLSNKFSKTKQILKSINSQIKIGILSLNQRFLALLMSPNHLQNAKIQIYDMNQPDKQFFILYKILQNIPANIKTIDFSTDNGYLVYKKSDEEQIIIDLTTKSPINTKQIQFQLQWNEQAKKTSKYIRQICSTYSDQNKLKTIVQIMNHSVIVTDEMGSIRIFKYEQNIQENTTQYYRVYLEHLNDIYLCIASADCNILVSVGKHDKSIIIWKIKNFDIKVVKNIKRNQLI